MLKTGGGMLYIAVFIYSLNYLFIFILCVLVLCLHGVRVSNPLKLELQTLVNCLVGAEWSLGRAASVLNH